MKPTDIIAIATGNPHKIEEIREILKGLPLALRSGSEFPGFVSPEEDAPDLPGNALIKARALMHLSHVSSLADDTGLEVDVLRGAPGVHSARYSGSAATAKSNVEKLLKEMKDIPDERRSARFRCIIALCHPNGEELLFEGIVEGRITRSPQGKGGFGYDSVFMPDGYDQTFAELSMEEKNRISHRGRALQKLKEYLKKVSDGNSQLSAA